MSTKQLCIVCITILISAIIHASLIQNNRYSFSANMNGNIGYSFDRINGTLKIFPISLGFYGDNIPYSTVDTKTMGFDTFDEDRKSSVSKEMLRNVEKMMKEKGFK